MNVSSPSLLIRADATTAIGIGHVMRMLALAQAWADRGGKVELLGRIEAPGLTERLKEAGVLVRPLESIHPHPGDLRSLLSVIKASPPTWITLDGYHFDQHYQAEVHGLGSRVLVVDDMGHHPAYKADLLLNQNLAAENLPYNAPGAHLLLGPRYALLRREFRHAAPSDRRAGSAKRILVSAGGADTAGLTPLLLDALACSGRTDFEARVICGPANPHREELTQKAQALPFPAKIISPGADMPNHMGWAELAFCAAGSTCWELARMGVPMLAFVVAHNQRGVLEGLVQAGLAVDGGTMGHLASKAIANTLCALADDAVRLSSLSEGARELIDGQGAPRVVETMSPTLARLRPAVPEDCTWFFRLANDPQVRASSFCTRPIALKEHSQWFQARLADVGCRLFVAENQRSEPLGQVRLDDKGDHSIVSISLVRDYRGLGLGSGLLRLAAERSQAEFGVPAHALIRPDNLRSLCAFAKAGFRDEGTTMASGVPARLLVHTAVAL